MSQTDPDTEKPLDPEQQAVVARVKWLMLMSGFATFLGIAVVMGVIGYRFFRSDGSAGPVEMTAMLPKGARVVSTAVTEDRITVTVETGGSIELRTFDLKSLRPTGRLRFASEPSAQPCSAFRPGGILAALNGADGGDNGGCDPGSR